MTQSREPPHRTVHAAASRQHCKDMADRYGWRLVDSKLNGDKILPVDCEFEGNAQFPNYMEK
jgi:hypothetical protein